MKIIVPINSYPTRNRKFQKLKNTITASFQAKPGWERPRKREKKNYRSYQFLPVTPSFKAKTGWERLRKRENEIYRSDQFLPNP